VTELYYDQRAAATTSANGNPVWLSIPNTGKLSPQWEGGWKISECKSPVTMTITDGERFKTVHVNRLRHCIQLELVTLCRNLLCLLGIHHR